MGEWGGGYDGECKRLIDTAFGSKYITHVKKKKIQLSAHNSLRKFADRKLKRTGGTRRAEKERWDILI